MDYTIDGIRLLIEEHGGVVTLGDFQRAGIT